MGYREFGGKVHAVRKHEDWDGDYIARCGEKITADADELVRHVWDDEKYCKGCSIRIICDWS